jgi:hypothetical protein
MSSDRDISSGEALDVLRSIERQNVTLKLTKSFRGISLNQDVSILEVDSSHAVLEATNLRMCAVLEGLTYLHGQELPKPLSARVVDLNIRRGIVILSDFSLVSAEWKARKHERVRQKFPTYVSLRCKSKPCRVPLEDVSLEGMGILAYQLDQRGVPLEPGGKICMDFQLAPGFRWSSVRGTVVYVQPRESSLARVGIQLYPDAKEARYLEGYIANRKKEILEEVTQVYMARSDPYSVINQYF